VTGNGSTLLFLHPVLPTAAETMITAIANLKLPGPNILFILLYFRFSKIWLVGERLSPMLVT
jgi:hypothetical protein